MIDMEKYYSSLSDEQILTLAYENCCPHNDLFVKTLAERLASLIAASTLDLNMKNDVFPPLFTLNGADISTYNPDFCLSGICNLLTALFKASLVTSSAHLVLKC